FPPPLK
nr:GTPase-activating protein GAP-3 - bovine (fragments) [Bos taurus]AAB20993.1 GAP-3, GTPase-activating protein [cattle, brain, Peptide Partial, 6 aa] [Bos taurus]